MRAREDDLDRAALRAVGIDEDEERVYRWLLLAEPAGPGDVRRALGLTARRAEALIGSLEAKGLLSRVGPAGRRVLPEPPDLAIDRLILRRREELEQAHQAAASLAVRFREPLLAAHRDAPVEMAVGPLAVDRHLEELAAAATDELLYLSTGEGWPPASGDERVKRRVIYDREALEAGPLPGGVDARCAGDVPVTLMVADRRIAVVALPAGPERPVAGALVRPSALLDALVALFDLLWSHAVPVAARQPAPGEPVSPEDSRLLSLLLAGLTDQGMARQLGCSVRTVQRRVRGLMSRWGVTTRPQLIWQATRAGWLGDG